ncbi:hypothetical protein ACFVFJ_02440 [Streptomyces sp. NPDC057717]|uniref:hypothetical protein n=1 Tax=unclassified Streptomyces TaxID=2593676 RepID=UPI00368B9852
MRGDSRPGEIRYASRARAGACLTEDVFTPVVGLHKDITMTMCMAYPPEEFAGTLERIADGTIDAAALVTGQADLGGVSAALDTLRRGPKTT